MNFDQPFVAATLDEVLSSGVAVCDVRWYADGRDGRNAYHQAHLPGARFVEISTALAGPAISDPPSGQSPLPSPSAFAEAMGRLGIGDDTPVLAYDDTDGMAAARMVWMLRAIGHPAAILDGGLSGWTGDLESGDRPVEPTTFTPREWPAERLADVDDVIAHIAAGGLLIDAGTPERYAGGSLSIHDRAGHIPSAKNLTWSHNLNEDAPTIRDATELRQYYQAAGVGPAAETIIYCGSGIAACHDLLSIEYSGLGFAKLYPGSWSQWSANPRRPIESS